MHQRTRRLVLALALLFIVVSVAFAVTPSRAQTNNIHLTMGNPSGAVSDPARFDNYLITRDQYALGYHRDRGIPTWVSWRLAAEDLGDTGRYAGQFIPDTTLPDGWYRVRHADYTLSGYDRGHVVPSADRTSSVTNNQATFILTNVLPQAPVNNQGPWAQLEALARDLARFGNELYIVSGSHGALGTLADGKLTIPAATWKALLILPAAAGNDIARVGSASQIIAVWMPNDATVAGRSWENYAVSVACIEQLTSLNLFSAVDPAVQAALEGEPCDPIGNPTPIPAPAAPDQRCFAETNQCIAGPIRSYWERNGGLPVFGFPIAAQAQEVVEGRTLQVQWFERDRLEIQTSGLVTAGRLGVERLAQLGTPWQPGANTPAGPGCTTCAETGHQMCGAFAAYWRANGGLERFGFPVTGQFQTVLEGQTYTVQYFERRRFELHPEIGPNAVLLGLLGREVRTGAPGAPPAPAQLPPSYNNCQPDPNANQAPNFPVQIVAIDKQAETVILRNASAQPITLNGWIMCSVRGNQQHPVGGPIAPGQTITFPGPSGNIWSNNENDPGALYDAQGRLISYWPD